MPDRRVFLDVSVHTVPVVVGSGTGGVRVSVCEGQRDAGQCKSLCHDHYRREHHPKARNAVDGANHDGKL